MSTQLSKFKNGNATAATITEPPGERATILVVAALAFGILILIGLVAALTILPAQLLSSAIVQQARSQQIEVAGSLSRQMEIFFNTLANDLLSLTQRNDIQSTTKAARPSALKQLNDLGGLRIGLIKSIVRLDRDGAPLYAWPDALNNTITRNQPLDWHIDPSIMQRIVQTSGVQFIKRPGGSGLAYLMIAPIPIGTDETQAIAFEVDLKGFFTDSFDPIKLSESSQLWVFEPQGPLAIYQRKPTPTWTANDSTIFSLRTVTARQSFPTNDRDAVIAPVYTAFTQDRSTAPSLIIVLSRISTEGQAEVYDTLNKLFFGGVSVVLLIVLLGLGVGRYVINQAERRRRDAQRRSTVRTLLEMSRALNSSLELPVVLNKILDELAILLPHDGASVMLLDDDPDDPTVTIAAQRGLDEANVNNIPLKKVRGTREVVRSGKPVVINDTHSDPRWNTTIGSQVIGSWMGVPLRVRDQAVGVLNINSGQPNRFGPDDEELAEAFADQACVAIENARAHQMQIRQYESELETAHAIQTSLLPSEVPPMPQIEIAAQSFPARHVSGDYYQYLPLPDGRLGVAVGDVSGKGIPAALLMAVITTALREEVLRQPSPAALLTTLNTDLLDRMQVNHMNSALLVAIFDPRTRHVEIANGGMVQPYVRTDAGWEFVPVGGYPLGASGRSNYSSKTVTLAPGAMLLFISDGVIEAQNHAGEFYGFERLEALLNTLPPDLSSSALVDCILQSVHDYLQGLEAQDDVTVVVMKSVEI